MNDPRFRKDKCRKCGGPLFVLKWASKKPRTCYACAHQPKGERK